MYNATFTKVCKTFHSSSKAGQGSFFIIFQQNTKTQINLMNPV